MQLKSAKFSPISNGRYAVYSQEDIFLISEKDEDFETFRRHNAEYEDKGGSVVELLKNLYSQIQSDGSECVLTKFDNGFVYLLCAGGAGAFVCRNSKLVPLVKTSNSDMSTVSGPVKPGDSFLFANHEVFSRLGLDVIENALRQSSPDLSLEVIVSNLGEVDSAVLVIKAEGDLALSREEGERQPNPETAVESDEGVRKGFAKSLDRLINRLTNRKIVVKNEREYSGGSRKVSYIGFLILILLLAGIYFGVKADQERRQRMQYEPKLKQAEFSLNEAKDLVSLSPNRARDLVLESRQMALELRDSGVEDERLDRLWDDIKTSLGPIAGIYEFDQNVFLDLSLISSEFRGDDIDFASNMVRVLDFGTKRLVGIDIESKRTEVISGPEFLPDALQTFAYEDRSFILSSDGIREVTGEVELVIKPEVWSAQDILARAYAGNIYVLDRASDKILRYQGVRGGFLEAEDWIAEDINVDTSGSIDMAIDGQIWTLGQNGEINRFLSGVPQGYSPLGERALLSNPKSLYTDESSKFVYVLDGGSPRVVVFDKNGNYIAEYTNSVLQLAVDIIVSENTGRALFLAEGKLYSIELKHLELENEDN